MDTSGFSVEVREINGLREAAEVVIRGPLDAKGALSFKAQMQPLSDGGVRRFLLQMEDVKYVNSTGLAYLINLSESLRETRGAVALVGVQPKVKILLDTMGVSDFFRLHAKRDAALQDLKTLAPASAPITTRREGSSTKTGRLSPPTDVPPKKKPKGIVRFFRSLFGR